MPRLARNDVLFEGCYAHVISRSIRKMKILKDDVDFNELMRLFHLTKRSCRYRIFHYCLMHTHFHLVVSMSNVSLFSRALHYVKSQYTLHFHTRYRLSGPIWRERFKAIPIEDERYLKACGEYVENNPLKAGLVKDSKDWQYSSFRHYNDFYQDSLIDSYTQDKKAFGPVELEFDPEEFFEGGKAIGSAFYRFKFYERLKRR